MPYELANRLVIGIASSALFDLTTSDAYFVEHGEDEYRKYQADHIDDTLSPGVAFEFIRRLLALNDLREADDPLVEVIILSMNDPSTGLRVMRSIEKHGLPITRAVFTQGQSPYAYISAFSMSLFLSGNEAHVREAMRLGYPAGVVLGSVHANTDDDGSVRVALDFDGVIADDEAERVYQSDGALDAFREHEVSKRAIPLRDGPLAEFLRDLNLIQEVERQRSVEDATHRHRLRVSIVTARNAPAHERAIHTLDEWGVRVNDAFFLGGIAKEHVLKVLRPHIFFDDQTTHLSAAAEHVPSVHIPYGVVNEASVNRDEDPPYPGGAEHPPSEYKPDPRI